MIRIDLPAVRDAIIINIADATVKKECANKELKTKNNKKLLGGHISTINGSKIADIFNTAIAPKVIIKKHKSNNIKTHKFIENKIRNNK